MKKLLILLLMASLMLPVHAFAQTNMELQLEVRFANLERIARTIEVTMDALTSYIKEINGDATKLDDYKSEFLEKKSDLKTAGNHQELDIKIQAASAVVTKFWEEYKLQVDSNKGSPLLAAKKILEAWKAAKPELDQLTDDYWQVRKTNVLVIFDNDVAAGQKIVDTLVNHPNKDKMQAKLDEIKGKKSSLESALESRNEVLIVNTQTDIILLAQEFGNLVAGKG